MTFSTETDKPSDKLFVFVCLGYVLLRNMMKTVTNKFRKSAYSSLSVTVYTHHVDTQQRDLTASCRSHLLRRLLHGWKGAISHIQYDH